MADNPLMRPIRSFVRREGRLTPAQNRALDELLPIYQIPPSDTVINSADVFGNDHPVVLEIGFGNGTLLAEQAAKYHDYNFIGIEVHRPGVGRLLQRLDEQDIRNVRVMCDDAMEILSSQLAPNSLHAVWLFFPDPWPKKRHHKRRIVNDKFLTRVAIVLHANGTLHMATDWQDYAQHMQIAIEENSCFSLLDTAALSDYPFTRPSTHFERRGQRRGHSITDLYARKMSS